MNEYVTVGATARAHSDNGNLKDDGRHTFVYDYKNRLIGAFDKATNNPVAAYLYYCDNRRAKKIVYSQTSPGVIERQERFFYDGQQVVEETDDAGNTLLTWVYSPVYVDEPVQYVRSSSHSLGAGTFYLHQNARADVVAVTDGAGAVAERRLYDDYGRSFDGVSKAPVAGSAVGNVYGFQGRRLDAETGLYYFRARYYDPETGRFVQRDPVWDPGNFGNQYSFVGNGPVSKGDPEGEQGPSAIDHYTSKKYSGDEAANRDALKATIQKIAPRYGGKSSDPALGLAIATLPLGGPLASVAGRLAGGAMARILGPKAAQVASRVAEEAASEGLSKAVGKVAGAGKKPVPKGPPLSDIRSFGQKGLRDPKSVDKLKRDMLEGKFRFDSPEGQIGGSRTPSGRFFVGEGHHRMNAALEIFEETGDRSYIDKLLKKGEWTPVSRPPPGHCSIPRRRSFLKRLFLKAAKRLKRGK